MFSAWFLALSFSETPIAVADERRVEQPNAPGAVSHSAPEIAVEPLDVWEPIAAEEFSTEPKDERATRHQPGKGPPTIQQLLNLGEYLEGEDDPESANAEGTAETSLSQEVPKFRSEVRLSKSQRKRLRAAQRYLRARARSYQMEVAQQNRRSRRGRPELRVCSADLNNFGLAGEVKKLIPRGRFSPLARTKQFRESIFGCACDVVALQGVIGRTHSAAKSAVLRLSEALTTGPEEKHAWHGFVGIGGSTVYNGLLYRASPHMVFVSSWIHTDKRLPDEKGGFGEPFHRTPIELTLRVENRDGGEARQVRLVVFDLRKGVLPSRTPDLDGEIRAAESLRRIGYELQFSSAPEDYPITVVAGESDRRISPATVRVLEGRLRAGDFGAGRPCQFEKRALRCTEVEPRPQQLFPVARDYREGQPASLFLLQNDLSYAKEDVGAGSKFAAGRCELKNGKRNAALHWLELNW